MLQQSSLIKHLGKLICGPFTKGRKGLNVNEFKYISGRPAFEIQP